MTGPLSFVVSPAQMRTAARTVAKDSDTWLSDLALISSSDAPAFGTGGFAEAAAQFHAQTHSRSMDYYREVGDAAGDVSIGLGKMANLYEAVEKNAVERARAVFAAAEIGAEVGLL